MIRDRLIPAIKAAFPDTPFVFASPPGPIAKLPGISDAIDELLIYDDDCEATVSIAKITHGHFNPYDQSLTRDQIDERVTADVINFLRSLFADRVLLFRALSGKMAGWEVFNEKPTEKFVKDCEYFVWSGPYCPR